MAATDKTYRPQHTLDIVFAVSCVLMLVSVIWMFAADYDREFKHIQRQFRDVDDALTERTLIQKIPDPAKVTEASEAVTNARKELDAVKARNASALSSLLKDKARAEARAQSIKADYDSVSSLYNIDIENRDAATDTARREVLNSVANRRGEQVRQLEAELDEAQREVDRIDRELRSKQEEQRQAEKTLSDAEDHLKKVSGEFDRIAKATAQKRWKLGDYIRNLPILDAFASPTKIQQYTLADYPIDYSFKYVTRYDRCTTCHLGTEKSNFTKEALRNLREPVSDEMQNRLTEARDLLLERQKRGENLGFDPNDIPKTVKPLALSDAQVNQFCAHPRLDLFVDPNSPHPAEKFGCTSCHAGQGSATDFVLAAHTPNHPAQKEDWQNRFDWSSSHFWDYPMLAKRFVESGCLKCHHQVAELQAEERRTDFVEGKAPPGPGAKLVRGFFLVREAGCFGCHEISGLKNNREIGPDLRLEPAPPLEAYTPAERAKLLSDPLNPPGTMRKVGPSLYRLVEKTNPQWTRRWIEAPRGFRPNTRMPHFYGLSNNNPSDPEALPADQRDFPNVEIHAIAHYLFKESHDYLTGKDKYRLAYEDRIQEYQQKKQAGLASEQELKLLDELQRRMQLDRPPVPLAQRLVDSEGNVVQLPAAPADAKAQEEQRHRGRQLFSERGCLACHQHHATTRADGDLPPVTSEQYFGPDLSRLAAKIAPVEGGPDARRRWLVQWIMDPKVHSPRTRMPITHLNVAQAADVAAWLLAQPLEGWDPQSDLPVPTSEAIANLARVFLIKAPGMTRQDVDDILKPTDGGKHQGLKDVKSLPRDADEHALAGPLDDDALLWYIGRKAITRLGCFGCHDVPGFATAKPIGTPLNDWGRKDAERLAFEDIDAYVRSHYTLVDSMTDDKGHGPSVEDHTKPPYDRFFFEALEHHQREGFLHQKLVMPRSYDFNRLRTWDDRLRMPQFKFARGQAKPLEGESQEQADAREEAEAREAVMTFILGLVAEPVPDKYLYNPTPDRLAEVKGLTVLEKYNCAGCHELRAGVYDWKKSENMLQQLDGFYDTAKTSFPADFPFTDHNAWVGTNPIAGDRLTVHGVPIPGNDDPKLLLLRLTEALRFVNAAKETRDLPAASSIGVPLEELLSRAEPYGGTFAHLMVPYLEKRDPTFYKDYKTNRAALPPPLLREGEKVQPAWLFRFLKNPEPIRFMKERYPVPGTLGTILRMPRFSLSDDEAMTLVNYFASVDRLTNPAEGVNYPYIHLPQREPEFWQRQNEIYVGRLGKARVDERLRQLESTWEVLLREKVAEAEHRLQSAEAALKTSKPEDKAGATQLRDTTKKELDQLRNQLNKKDFSALNRTWVEHEAYAADAFRLLANYNNPCLSCHQVGNLPPKQAQGPPLTLSWERLRPDWTLRWIANPDRLLSYPTPMPQNFPRNQVDDKGNGNLYPELVGTPLEQVTAVRDLLLDFPRIADLPVNRFHR
jgi:mono/diheme cytochrome c family protein